jgi:hypothetical protein
MYTILWVAFLDPSDSYFLFADLVGLNTHWTYMHIFLSNYWWQKSDIWSQASYRYPISWEAFLDPSDSYFLFADFVDFYAHWTYMLIFRRIFLSNYWWQESDICWEKCDGKCAYMFNVYKNQLSRQTGSRKLTGTKTLPTIWDTYMKLVTKYQIPVINSCWEKCDEKCAYMFNVFKNQLSRQTGSFLSNYWWQKSDIWSQASYWYPISWEAFLDSSDSYFLFADFVDFYTHWTYILYMPIFSRIFLSNYWWQKSDIWSQASYRYLISWEVCLIQFERTIYLYARIDLNTFFFYKSCNHFTLKPYWDIFCMSLIRTTCFRNNLHQLRSKSNVVCTTHF